MGASSCRASVSARHSRRGTRDVGHDRRHARPRELAPGALRRRARTRRRSRTLEAAACSCCRASRSRCRPASAASSTPLVGRPGEEHQPRRRGDQGRAGSADELAALAAMIGALRRGRERRSSPRFSRAMRRYFEARAHELSAASGVGRAVSWRKDDSRLHVDAFPSRPNRGERILRVFCNVNPQRGPRVARRRAFDAMARALPAAHPAAASRRGGARCRRCASPRPPRSEYDHLMLGLHDAAKADLAYQRDSPQREVRFAPGTTWICFSDQVMHAAIVGPVHARADDPSAAGRALRRRSDSPLAVLERPSPGRPLARADAAARAGARCR